MKHLIFFLTISTLTLAACNSESNQSSDENLAADNTAAVNSETASSGTTSPVGGIVNDYLQLKNALANDDGKAAADAGSQLANALKSFDKSSPAPDKTKVYENVANDALEHAEHISENGGNIKHQREHFEMLTKDIYDLAKAMGTEQSLYVIHCPMYDNNKGADWLSETKEVRNPYFGKKMATCGEVKEELK